MAKKIPYKRGWHHTHTRGKETVINCSFCGRLVPKYKTFAVYRGFSITDPLLKKELGRKNLSLTSAKMYACPSCARHRRIVKKKKR
jgi:small subunit ribosomal protein S26e